MDKEEKTKKDQIKWAKDVSSYEFSATVRKIKDVEVFRAYCPKTHKRCSIKKIYASCLSEEDIRDIEIRIATLNKFHHHSLNKCLTTFMENDNYYLVMNDYKYTLKDILESEQFVDGFEIFEVITIVSPIFRALAYIHAAKLYHGYVNVQNIQFSNDSIMLGGFEDGYKNQKEGLGNNAFISEKQRQDIVDLLVVLISLIKKKYKSMFKDKESEQFCLKRDVSKLCILLCDILKKLKTDTKDSSENELNEESILVIEKIADVIVKDIEKDTEENNEVKKKENSPALSSSVQNEEDKVINELNNNTGSDNIPIQNEKLESNTKKGGGEISSDMIPLSVKIISEWKKFELSIQESSPDTQITKSPSIVDSNGFGLRGYTGTVSVNSKSINSAQLSAMKEPMCMASTSTTVTKTKQDDNMNQSHIDMKPMVEIDKKFVAIEPTAQTPGIHQTRNINININNQLTVVSDSDRNSIIVDNNNSIQPQNEKTISGTRAKNENNTMEKNIGKFDQTKISETTKSLANENERSPKKKTEGKEARNKQSQKIHIGDASEFKTILCNIIKRVKDNHSKKLAEKQILPRLHRSCSKFSIKINNPNIDPQTDKQEDQSLSCINNKFPLDLKRDSIIIKISSPKTCTACASHNTDFEETQVKVLPCKKVISVINTKPIAKNFQTKVGESEEDEDIPKSERKISSVFPVDTKSPNSARQPQSIGNFQQQQQQQQPFRKSIMIATVHNMANNKDQDPAIKSNQPNISGNNVNTNAVNSNNSLGTQPQSLISNKSTSSIQGEKKGRFVIQASNQNNFNPQTLQSCTILPSNSASSSLQKNVTSNNNNNVAEMKNYGLGLDAIQSCNALVSRIGRLRHELSALREENNKLLFLYRDLRARTDDESISVQE